MIFLLLIRKTYATDTEIALSSIGRLMSPIADYCGKSRGLLKCYVALLVLILINDIRLFASKSRINKKSPFLPDTGTCFVEID